MCDGHMKSLIKLIEPTPKNITNFRLHPAGIRGLSLDDFRIVVVVAVRVNSWKKIDVQKNSKEDFTNILLVQLTQKTVPFWASDSRNFEFSLITGR
jgi:hypothetical protein